MVYRKAIVKQLTIKPDDTKESLKYEEVFNELSNERIYSAIYGISKQIDFNNLTKII